MAKHKDCKAKAKPEVVWSDLKKMRSAGECPNCGLSGNVYRTGVRTDEGPRTVGWCAECGKYCQLF